MDQRYLKNPHLDGGPFLREGGPIGALLIHGYTATPAEVRLLGDNLAARGFTVLGPKLPGHGTTPEDLFKCHWQDWYAHVATAYGSLRRRCERVFVIGESLGGLLGLHLAALEPTVAGLVVCAPALIARNKLIHLAPLLKRFIRTLPKRRSASASSTIVDQRWQGYSVDVAAAAAQLLASQRRVRHELSLVTQPIIVFQGRLDQTVDPLSAEVVYRRVGSRDRELVWLERSTHCLLLDVEWESAAERIAQFMRDHS